MGIRLIVEGIYKAFQNKKVLNGIDADFEQGRVTALLGRNGAGKTTFFSILAGELTADSGNAWLEENGERRRLVPEDLFFMVSEPTLPNFLTGREMISFFIDANRKRLSGDLTPDPFFDQVDFEEEDRDRLIQDYSTGMKNKLQMIMFLILRPKVILMDEPLTSLDVVVQLEMRNLIRSIHEDHIIIFSTHILQLAQDLCDDVVLLRDGVMQRMDEDIHGEDIEKRIISLLKQDADTEAKDGLPENNSEEGGA
ncbi:ATP-binding cassette domain-containing protein [Peptoniphilaceae bacterium SGI.137]|nr:ABC transporter ATP-binding protein [Peptoniphilaceae bacterium]MDY5765835.1 ABC transporter ATP-binding protein [Peptoniphilaceae bacterium]MDY5842686.1 ABC transporter ATP-binding protein [Peptoniphilaceae bacterium]MDY6147221.1 ABC transporter ATP-binding protein [Peptoniphilaceae bacterium]